MSSTTLSKDTTTRRQRLLFGGRPSGWALLVPVTFFLAGLLFALSADVSRGYDIRKSGAYDLPDLVAARSRQLAHRQDQVGTLQEEVRALTARQSPFTAQLTPITRRTNALAGPAAMTPVTGPGIEVTLNDSDRPLSSLDGYTADDLVIHKQDIQNVVNAMWRGGAEAMMIQDQRVIATSAVRCVGNTLLLQGRVYSPPYTIRAIGDVKGMRKAIDADEQVDIFMGYVRGAGVRYDLAEKTSLSFPGYDGSTALHYARVTP